MPQHQFELQGRSNQRLVKHEKKSQEQFGLLKLLNLTPPPKKKKKKLTVLSKIVIHVDNCFIFAFESFINVVI